MKLRLTFALMVLVGALFTSSHASAFSAGYVCRGSHTTATATGVGGTCTAAASSLLSILDNYAETDCYSDIYSDHACKVTVTDTAPCACSGGVCQQSGYGTHACADCGYPGGPICP